MAGLIERDQLVGNLLDRLDEMEERIRILEATHPGLPGEAADQLAYYRPNDGALYTAGDVWCPDDGDLHGNQNEAGTQERFDMLTAGLPYSLWTEHFDGDSRPAGWAVAGAPFAAFLLEDYVNVNSCVYMGAPVASRCFLYRSEANDTTYLKCAATILTASFYAGIRWDDGSDNNYIELLLSQVTGVGSGAWNYWYQAITVRYRTGGGAVVTHQQNPVYVGGTVFLQLSMNGTFGVNWSISAIAAIGGSDLAFQGKVWATSGQPGALTWTPSRQGIIVDNGSALYNWYRFTVDAWGPY